MLPGCSIICVAVHMLPTHSLLCARVFAGLGRMTSFAELGSKTFSFLDVPLGEERVEQNVVQLLRVVRELTVLKPCLTTVIDGVQDNHRPWNPVWPLPASQTIQLAMQCKMSGRRACCTLRCLCKPLSFYLAVRGTTATARQSPFHLHSRGVVLTLWLLLPTPPFSYIGSGQCLAVKGKYLIG